MLGSAKRVSIQLRVRRIVHEDAYILVPVTDAVLQRRADGSVGIDFDALVAEAARLSTAPGVDWKQETVEATVAHPIQGPLPEGRFSFSPVKDDG